MATIDIEFYNCRELKMNDRSQLDYYQHYSISVICDLTLSVFSDIFSKKIKIDFLLMILLKAYI